MLLCCTARSTRLVLPCPERYSIICLRFGYETTSVFFVLHIVATDWV